MAREEKSQFMQGTVRTRLCRVAGNFCGFLPFLRFLSRNGGKFASWLGTSCNNAAERDGGGIQLSRVQTTRNAREEGDRGRFPRGLVGSATDLESKAQ